MDAIVSGILAGKSIGRAALIPRRLRLDREPQYQAQQQCGAHDPQNDDTRFDIGMRIFV
jgi:hypothetical protein